MFTGTLKFNIDPEDNIPDYKILELMKSA